MVPVLQWLDHRLRFDRLARRSGLLRADRLAGSPRAFIAGTPLARAIGLLGTPDPRDDEVLVLAPCASVHGVGLRAVIGAAFIDRNGVVLRVVDPLPWRGAHARGAHAVIEACAGVLADLRPGDTVFVDDDDLFPLRGNSAAA